MEPRRSTRLNNSLGCRIDAAGSEAAFASDAASSVTAALNNYIPFARRRDGRLYTMAKNSYYAYAPGQLIAVFNR